MRRFIILFMLGITPTLIDGRGTGRMQKPRIEGSGKLNLLLSDAMAVGLGTEIIVNPFSRFGLRYEFFNLQYGSQIFSISLFDNMASNLDALIYLPMSGYEPYLHFGFSLSSVFGSGTSSWGYGFRGGMGINYRLNKKLNLFGETGVLFNDLTSEPSRTTFRFSLGTRASFSK